MGIPRASWLDDLKSYQSSAHDSEAVGKGLVDAKYARECEVYWAKDKSDRKEQFKEAIKNYKSAADFFWDAYRPENTHYIWAELSAAAKTATARAEELEKDSSKSSEKDTDGPCQCDTCRMQRQQQYQHHNYCYMHQRWNA